MSVRVHKRRGGKGEILYIPGADEGKTRVSGSEEGGTGLSRGEKKKKFDLGDLVPSRNDAVTCRGNVGCKAISSTKDE